MKIWRWLCKPLARHSPEKAATVAMIALADEAKQRKHDSLTRLENAIEERKDVWAIERRIHGPFGRTLK